MNYTRPLLKDILDWDVHTWKKAIFLWDRCAPEVAGARVLELGAGRGGLSLYFALRGATVVCSDVQWHYASVPALHEQYGVSSRITYAAFSATSIPEPDASFDIVCFKSILGAIGQDDNFPQAQRAVGEMHRVLKPGGRLLFAENVTGTPLHGYLRRKVVPWGSRWKYMRPHEIYKLLMPFREHDLRFTGVVAALGRSEFQRSILHALDVVVQPLTPRSWRYVVYGWARK
ncbi:MAG TPA: class I SAM-dependent methyltransferase [Phycisphaerae bacterium]|nr:class I SAM-dependent methyltransferase [Phycisphaerae bacterium]